MLGRDVKGRPGEGKGVWGNGWIKQNNTCACIKGEKQEPKGGRKQKLCKSLIWNRFRTWAVAVNGGYTFYGMDAETVMGSF